MDSVEEIYKTIGLRIKQIRTQRNESQTEFGKNIGNVDRALISKWELGKNKPNKERLERIADLGNVSVEWLLNGVDSHDISNIELYDFLSDKLEKYIVRVPYRYEFNLATRSIAEGILEVFGIKKDLHAVTHYEDLNDKLIQELRNESYKLLTPFKNYNFEKFMKEHSTNSPYAPPTLESYQSFKEDIWQDIRKELK